MKQTHFSRLLNFTVLLIAVSGAFSSPTAYAQSSLTDDAHTRTAPSSSDTNFGSNPNLALSSSGNVYLKFNLVATLPAGTPSAMVDKATLTLFISNLTSPGKLDVYEVASGWQESTITANTAPVLGDFVTTSEQLTPDQKGKFLVIDITTTVQKWLGSDGQGTGGIQNHGIALIAHPTDWNTPEIAAVIFDSKENPQTSHEPRLQIYLKGEASAGLDSVAHDATLTGDGTPGSLLGVADGAISTAQLAGGAVTGAKLAAGAVTTTTMADGAVTSAKIATPLSLTSVDPGGTLSVTNTGGGPAITTTGAINVAGNLTADGSIIVAGLRTEVTAATPNVIGGFSGNIVTAGVIGAAIGGGGEAAFFNRITDDFGTIGGGSDNQAGDNVGSTSGARFATVGGGFANTASGIQSTVGGGFNNTASGNTSTVGGGATNVASDAQAYVGGGAINSASGQRSTIGGGFNNTASGVHSTIGGGSNNTASGLETTVPGGADNVAQGNFSFSAGRRAKANHHGAFVWADSTFADFASTGDNQFLIRASGGVGIGTNAPADQLHVGGIIRVDLLGAAGADHLCLNASNQISTCGSSLRYKDQIVPYSSGLNLIERLRPITFSWKTGGSRDLGFGAEEVAEVDPLLVTRNGKGEVEGVKYDRIAVVLVNAVKEQQQLIKAQQLLLESQQRQIESLKKIVCLDRPDAQICR